VLPGASFGEAGEGYVRIAFTVGADRIGEAVTRMAALRDRMLGAG